MFLDWQQTGSRQPQGTSSVSGAREGRAQLDASRLHPGSIMQLQGF